MLNIHRRVVDSVNHAAASQEAVSFMSQGKHLHVISGVTHTVSAVWLTRNHLGDLQFRQKGPMVELGRDFVTDG